MFLLAAIIPTLHLAVSASDFLDECPINKNHLIGDDRVVDILRTFYNDLSLVRACTDSGEHSDYFPLLEEIKSVATSLTEGESVQSTREAYNLFSDVVRLLREKRPLEAYIYLVEDKSDVYNSGWRMTYFEYLQAEVHKQTGNYDSASDALMLAFLERRDSMGISMNELERLDGLLALQRVSEFNQNVDRLYGLRESPNYQLLSVAYSLFKDDLNPLNKIRSAVFDRLFWTANKNGSSRSDSSSTEQYDVVRSDPNLDDFSGKSVPKASAESLLCEFAQKLAILCVSSTEKQVSPPDYSEVMDQLRELDADFAGRLEERVVRHIATNIEHAKSEVRDMWVDMVYDSPRGDKIQAIFVGYFNIELYHRQLEDICNLWKLNYLQEDMDTIQWLRQKHKGISMDKLAELEAKFVLLWMNCFHERVKLAYDLDGTERTHILEAKRSLYVNSCQRTLPDSYMFRVTARD